jgi:organic hydroperoxide reductase OsmC/OhrA
MRGGFAATSIVSTWARRARSASPRDYLVEPMSAPSRRLTSTVAAMSQEGMSVHRARLRWDTDREDLRAHTIELAGQKLAASSAPEFGGNSAKADPEEMFVASLSSCHMLWFLALARGERVRVTSYEDEPEGTMDGIKFTRVILRPRVAFEHDPDEEQFRSLHRRAHERCFIANSVNCPVDVEPRR